MVSITKSLYSKNGSIHMSFDHRRCLLIAKPKKYIDLNLIKQDLSEAREFGQKLKRPWTYIVDTTIVRFAHPLNTLYLSKIKKLPYIDKYYIVAPSIIIRLAQLLLSPSLRVDKVFKSYKELDLHLDIR